MIPLTRLNGEQVAINPDRIERADITPDVVLTMTDGSKYVIAESLDELIDRIRLFRASVLALSHHLVFDDGEVEGSHGRLRIVRGGGAAGAGPIAGPAVEVLRPPVSLRALQDPVPDALAGAATVEAPPAAAGSAGDSSDGSPQHSPPDAAPGV